MVAWVSSRVFFGSVPKTLAYLNNKEIFIADRNVDLGRIRFKEHYRHTFPVDNISNHAIKLLGVQLSCSCMVVESVPLTIPAHGSHDLSVEINLKKETPDFSESLTLFTDSPIQPRLVLTIRGKAE